MNIAILRASNGQKMLEIFTNKETLLSEKRKREKVKNLILLRIFVWD